MDNFIYIIIAFCLLLLELAYFRIAERLQIIDKPNERSSHAHPTIRGGGIIFVVASFLFSALNHGAYPYLMAALFLSGLVSFIDDVRSMPNWLRFLAHLASSSLVLFESGLGMLHPLLLGVLVVLAIGVINAYNFMDGINGITGFYSLSIILPLWFSETDPILKELEIYAVISILIFLFFNARIKARCFAGDVGSVTMAVLVLFLLLTRMHRTGNLSYIAFLLLYGVDAVLTIIQRLYLKENIFKAHRRHLFQLLSNEVKMPHLLVSILYALIQLCVNFWTVLNATSPYFLAGVILIFGVIYIIIKLQILRRVEVRKG